MTNQYLKGARQRWLGGEEELKHRVGYNQFDKASVDWYREQIFDHMLDGGLDAVGSCPAETILDYGCGVGRLLLPLSAQLGGIWYGVDISPDMIQVVSDKIGDGDADNVAGVATADGDGIPEGFVEPHSVDHIYSVITFQHIADHSVVRSILASWRRCLVQGGWFTLQVKKYRDGLRPWDYVPPASGEPDSTGYDELPEHLQAEEGCAYTHEEIVRVCEEAGLHALNTWETEPIDDHGEWLWVSGFRQR